MSIASIRIGDGTWVIYVGGTQYTVPSDHPARKEIEAALKEQDEDRLVHLMDVKNSVKAVTQGKLEIKGDQIYYEGEVIHNLVCDQILQFMREGLPYRPLLNFLEKLMDNPSQRAVEAAFAFLQKAGLVICEDGDFLGYKSVTVSRMDHHSGKVHYPDGAVVTMRRNSIDESGTPCSKGLHIGTLEYASTFGGPDAVMIMVKVNPRDIVSLPDGDTAWKLRTCRLEVIKEVPKEAYCATLYNNDGTEYENDDDDEDDDWDECDSCGEEGCYGECEYDEECGDCGKIGENCECW